ncbi:AbrB/MazE/SpoVT family DNA-binding domain-containing protein [Candidatus Woesearchaeota archaeon]|nr:AbrB/MazE/SpoVT family DNA-binding domain-containing protein [Candidatus Woesearchaeota archaeon]
MISVKTKQWGNSIGIVIPKAVAEEKGIISGEEVLVEIEKKSRKTALQELFGALPFKKPTEQLVKESRMGLESRYE